MDLRGQFKQLLEALRLAIVELAAEFFFLLERALRKGGVVGRGGYILLRKIMRKQFAYDLVHTSPTEQS